MSCSIYKRKTTLGIALWWIALADIGSCVQYENDSAWLRETDPFLNRANRKHGNGLNFISFKPLDHTLLVGMDLLIPFITVPLNRTGDADKNALVNVNAASVVLSGLVALLGGTVGGIFRKFGTLSKSDVDSRVNSRALDDVEEAANLLDPFKMVYTNSKGARIETTLNDLWSTMKEKFHENGIDLSACVQKAICSYVQKCDLSVRNGHATGFHKIVDGLSSLQWILRFLEGTSLYDAIDTGKSTGNTAFCDYKYASCMWSDPENHLLDLAKNYVNFI